MLCTKANSSIYFFSSRSYIQYKTEKREKSNIYIFCLFVTEIKWCVLFWGLWCLMNQITVCVCVMEPFITQTFTIRHHMVHKSNV